MTVKTNDRLIQLALAITLFLNIVFWFSIRDVQARWENVPPPPSEKFASAYGLGDKSLAYRTNGLMIQNMGDTGGRLTSLVDYDFERLTKWFFLQDYLDEKSNYTPYLAAFYFGSVQDPQKYRPVLPYLTEVGMRPYGQKWRWLVHAVQITKDKLQDNEKALELAQLLAQSKHPDMPNWVQQMPVFVLTDKGQKEAAYALMLEILKSSSENMHPNEIYSMRIYICNKILDQQEAQDNPLCEGITE